MRILIYACAILVLCVLLASLLLLWYHPSFTPKKRVVKEETAEEEKDAYSYYAQTVKDLDIQYANAMVLFSRRVFPNGLLLHYLGKTEEKYKICLYFHEEKTFRLCMQAIEEMVSENQSFVGEVTICYCRKESAAFSAQLAQYFRDHNQRFDLVLHDLTTLYMYGQSKHYTACLGVMRKAHVSLENQTDKQVDSSNLLLESSLWKPAYALLRKELPWRLRMQIRFPLTRFTGLYHLFEMDERIRDDFFANVVSQGKRIEVTCSNDEEKEICLAEILKQNISYKMVREEESGLPYEKDAICDWVCASITASYDAVPVAETLYDNRTDRVMEHFSAHCFSFAPLTDIHQSRLAGILFYKNLLKG